MTVVRLDDRRAPHPNRAKREKDARLRGASHPIEEMHVLMRHCHESPTARAQFVEEARRASGS